MKHQLRQWYYRVCLFLGIYKREDFVTVSDVLDEAYKDLYTFPHRRGLCFSLKSALYKCAGIDAYYLRIYIPKFTKEFVGAPEQTTSFGLWWPDLHGLKGKQIRLEALTKLHNYYINHDELILKGKEL